MNDFVLPPVARRGDRVPDTWLQPADGGERVRLHKRFGGRPMWLAVAGASGAPALPPLAGDQGLLIARSAFEAPDGWRAFIADSAWCELFEPGVLELDANFRVVRAPGEPAEGFTTAPVAALDAASTGTCAPVLQIPDVLEPALCRALLDHFEQACGGGDDSHVLVLEHGRQTPRIDPDIKLRRESPIRDAALEAAVDARMRRRVLPEMLRVFQFGVSRRDPFKLLAYPQGAGYFRPHRDNDTPDVAHRRFAISVNLNAGAYRGGAFRFPEFGPHPYAPSTGAVLVFSCSLLHEVLAVEAGTRHSLTTFVD